MDFVLMGPEGMAKGHKVDSNSTTLHQKTTSYMGRFFYLSNQLLWFWNRWLFAVAVLCIVKTLSSIPTLHLPNTNDIPKPAMTTKGCLPKYPNVAIGHHFPPLRSPYVQYFENLTKNYLDEESFTTFKSVNKWKAAETSCALQYSLYLCTQHFWL